MVNFYFSGGNRAVLLLGVLLIFLMVNDVVGYISRRRDQAHRNQSERDRSNVAGTLPPTRKNEGGEDKDVLCPLPDSD